MCGLCGFTGEVLNRDTVIREMTARITHRQGRLHTRGSRATSSAPDEELTPSVPSLHVGGGLLLPLKAFHLNVTRVLYHSFFGLSMGFGGFLLTPSSTSHTFP